MQFPVNIELRRSCFLLCLQCFLHLLAVYSIASLAIWSWPVRGLLLIPVAVSLFFSLKPTNIGSLHILAKDRMEGSLKNGQRVQLSVLPQSGLFRFFLAVSLLVEETNEKIRLLVFKDQVTQEEYRLLSIWLRWHVSEKESESD